MTVVSCIEPIDVETEDFLDALVVDATITDEMDNHTIYLTRTYRFESESTAEQGAQITLSDDSGAAIGFDEVIPGTYRSSVPFAAQEGRAYTLKIVATNGISYSSRPAQLPQNVALDSVYAQRITNDFGEDGVAIFVDAFDPTGNSQNFRYEFEETYKIIAPKWRPEDLLSTGIECGVDVVPKTKEDQTCFASKASNRIILANTSNLEENRVDRFMVRFIDGENYIISHRYSVLVTQYTQSNEAYSFFDALNQFSSSESLFSETQPGFLSGNIFSETNQDEKVLGYFDVSAVSKKRIFFNYEDLYPGEDLPPYVNPCNTIAPMLISQGGARCVLSAMVDENQVSYYDENQDPPFEEGPYKVVPRECGDCTVLGKTERPEFWIE
ncbi:DUF4249 domain-containing protein [Flagellimonas nanhaiensis]|uniref:DUF4249 domain-containing protein n=1 Tax=Flagellimonas nanhaiensis TaxID=2292706 RepID=A0A371JUD1_9FLAO|nr:DUF4249 domain-containing protein [Allomuricauda nanhaiensis]RDY61410.1 DUF4249 domain-containing protein [Allomuricauda nanhaiensis]